MKPFPLHCSGEDIVKSNEILIVRTVLESGCSVELPASGFSMFPTFMPGNKVIIKPLSKGEVPEPGQVMVYFDGTKLVLHRLVKIINNGSDNPVFIAQGDSLILPDKPIMREQIEGIAVSYKTGRKEYPVRTYIPGTWHHKFNRWLLWFYNRLLLVYRKIKEKL